MKVYLAGPMSGIPKFNYPLFDEAARQLRRSYGYEVVSPADLNRALFPNCKELPGFEDGRGEETTSPEGTARRHAVMTDDLRAVLECDAIALLPGWENSVGSTIERRVAETCGKTVYLVDLDTWLLMADKQQVRISPAPVATTGEAGVRTFESGANRDDDARKHDYEGFLSIPALRVYGAYMHSHRALPNGQQRASDNWQQGFPPGVALKSSLRHVFDVWEIHRTGEAHDFDGGPVDIKDALCGAIFNLFEMLHQEATK